MTRPSTHLLLVSLDTLRADVAYSGKFPAIEGLRQSGVSFRRAVSSSPLTPISHATILTGQQPDRHGIRHLLREQLSASVPTLAEALRERGYVTGAVVSCPGMNRWYGFDRGFDHYDDWIPPLADGRDALEVVDVQVRGTALKRAGMVVDRALRWLERQPRNRPIFLFVHFFDAHWPYEPPDSFGEHAANPYEGEVAYMDHHLGNLLAGTAALGMTPERTVTVCLSDHGEDLAGWYHNDHAQRDGYRHEKGHGCLLFDTTQLVPLIVRAPSGIPAGTSVDVQVRLVDVAPTVAQLLDLDGPDGGGTSLVPAARGYSDEGEPAYFETFYLDELAALDPQWTHLRPLKGVRREHTKVIWEHGGDAVDYYDLQADPSESRPISLSG